MKEALYNIPDSDMRIDEEWRKANGIECYWRFGMLNDRFTQFASIVNNDTQAMLLSLRYQDVGFIEYEKE